MMLGSRCQHQLFLRPCYGFSSAGDFEDLVSMLDPTLNQANASINVTERQKGVPPMSKFVLLFGGIPTAPLSKTATASQVRRCS